jgi:hypothetical protein
MPSATLNRFRTVCQTFGVPMSTVATVVGVKPTSLSSALRDVMTLSGETEARLHSVAVRLSELRDAFEPVRLPDDPVALEKLVDNSESGHFSLDEIRSFVNRILDGETQPSIDGGTF